MKKYLIILSVLALVLVTGFYALNAYIYNEKQNRNASEEMPGAITLTGTYACLPSKKNITACMYGLRTDDGSYYLLDFDWITKEISSIALDDRISFRGTITPADQLKEVRWKDFDIVGKFSVLSSSLKKL